MIKLIFNVQVQQVQNIHLVVHQNCHHQIVNQFHQAVLKYRLHRHLVILSYLQVAHRNHQAQVLMFLQVRFYFINY